MTEPTLGELHRTLQRVEGKVDALDAKLDRHAERITRTEERQRAANGSAAKIGGFFGAFAAALVAGVAALLGIGTNGRQP